jgi:hypothetical protein
MRELLADLRRTVAVHRMRRLVEAAVGPLALAVGATAAVLDTRNVSSESPCAGAEAHLALPVNIRHRHDERELGLRGSDARSCRNNIH